MYEIALILVFSLSFSFYLSFAPESYSRGSINSDMVNILCVTIFPYFMCTYALLIYLPEIPFIDSLLILTQVTAVQSVARINCQQEHQDCYHGRSSRLLVHGRGFRCKLHLHRTSNPHMRHSCGAGYYSGCRIIFMVEQTVETITYLYIAFYYRDCLKTQCSPHYSKWAPKMLKKVYKSE